MKSVLNDIQQAGESEKNNIKVIGFGRRFLAMLIDGIIVVMVSFILAFLVGMVDVFFGKGVLSWNLIIVITMLIFSVLYFTGNWVQSSGQTLGKLLLNIRVVSKDGSPLSLGKLLLRYIGYIISGLPASLGFIWVGFDKERRGWHDMLSNTRVIHMRDDIPKDGKVTFIPSDPGKGWVWIVIWIFLAAGAPSLIFAGLWFLGPVVASILQSLR